MASESNEGNISVDKIVESLDPNRREKANKYIERQGTNGLANAVEVIQALPTYVSVESSALDRFKFNKEKAAPKTGFEPVIEEIFDRFTSLLPQGFDKYTFVPNEYGMLYAKDTIVVPGFKNADRGTESKNVDIGIFKDEKTGLTYISKIDCDIVRITTGEPSGVHLERGNNDISRVSGLEIKPKNRKIKFYSDKSGVHIQEGGKKYKTAMQPNPDNTYTITDRLIETDPNDSLKEIRPVPEVELTYSEIRDNSTTWLKNQVLVKSQQTGKNGHEVR